MRMRNVSGVFGLAVFIVVFFFVTGTAFSAKLLTKDNDFHDPDEVWDFIPDYTDMAEGDDIDWVWTKPGVSIPTFKTAAVPKFENISRQVDVYSQDLLTSTMKEGVGRLGLKSVDKGGAITIRGAMVDYFNGSTAANIWVGWGAGNPFVEVEVYVIDNATGEIISKVRHQAQSYSIETAISEVITEIINYWGTK